MSIISHQHDIAWDGGEPHSHPHATRARCTATRTIPICITGTSTRHGAPRGERPRTAQVVGGLQNAADHQWSGHGSGSEHGAGQRRT